MKKTRKTIVSMLSAVSSGLAVSSGIALSALLLPVNSANAVEALYTVPEGTVSITPADFAPLAEPEMLFPNEKTKGLEQWVPNKAKDPSIIWFRDRYLMYFSIFPTKDTPIDCCLGIGIAESKDLVQWDVVGVIPPLTEIDKKGCGAPCVKVWDDQVHIFYQSYGNGPKDAIIYATSKDGIKFTPHEQNPIFFPSGNWSNGRAIDADFFEFKGKCFLYVATRDPAGKIQKLAVAVADDRDELGRPNWKLAKDAPILEPELPWETRCIEAPTVIERNGRAYMFYAGGYNNDPQHIGVAVSDDGINYTRLWDVPFITNGPEGQWNRSESGHPGIFQDRDGQTYLFFQGNPTKGKTWYLSKVKIGWKQGEKSEIPYVMK